MAAATTTPEVGSIVYVKWTTWEAGEVTIVFDVEDDTYCNVRLASVGIVSVLAKKCRTAPPTNRRKAGTVAERVERTGETLPTIVEILGRDDSGEFGNTSCPHCGAAARYVTRFRLADGTEAGAAATCLTLFPKAPGV